MENEKTKRTTWTTKELSIVEEVVKEKDIIDSVKAIKKLLPNKRVDAIKAKVYKFKLENAPRITEGVSEIIVGEKLQNNQMVVTGLNNEMKTYAQAIADNGPKLAYNNELIVKQGVITVPFMGEIRCNFRITGNFFIEKLD